MTAGSSLPIAMFSGPRIKGFFHQDVLVGHVGEYESELGLVVGESQSVLKNLVHWRAEDDVRDRTGRLAHHLQATTTSNHSDMLVLVLWTGTQ